MWPGSAPRVVQAPPSAPAAPVVHSALHHTPHFKFTHPTAPDIARGKNGANARGSSLVHVSQTQTEPSTPVKEPEHHPEKMPEGPTSAAGSDSTPKAATPTPQKAGNPAASPVKSVETMEAPHKSAAFTTSTFYGINGVRHYLTNTPMHVQVEKVTPYWCLPSSRSQHPDPKTQHSVLPKSREHSWLLPVGAYPLRVATSWAHRVPLHRNISFSCITTLGAPSWTHMVHPQGPRIIFADGHMYKFTHHLVCLHK